MAAQLPDTWLTQLLDAYVVERVHPHAPRGHAGTGVRGSGRWLRRHLHRSGLAYGLPQVRAALLPSLSQGVDVPAAHTLATAAHFLDVISGTSEFLRPGQGAPQLRANVAAVFAVALDKDGALPLVLSSEPAPARVRQRVEQELGKALRKRLEAVFSAPLGAAVHAALVAAEARSLARIARRVALHGAPALARCRRLRDVASRERHTLVRNVVDLQRAIGWQWEGSVRSLRGHLVDAGLRRADAALVAEGTSRHHAPIHGHLLNLAITQVLLGSAELDAAALARLTSAAGLPAARMARLRRRARTLSARATHALPHAEAPAWAEALADWTTRTVSGHLDAVVQEIRETGELAALLARAGAGQHLTPEEWRKVREQLLDVVKAVPSLAVFALPGGAFLLPLLLKILPFDLRPSSFRPKSLPPPSAPPPSAPTEPPP